MNKVKYWLNNFWWNYLARYQLGFVPRDRVHNSWPVCSVIQWQQWLELNVGRQGCSWDWRLNDNDSITVKFFRQRDWLVCRAIRVWK